MIKAFAPMLGDFRGQGRLADGTGLVARLEGAEALPDQVYTFRARMTADDTGASLLDAFLVLSQNVAGGMEIQFHDARSHAQALAWAPGEETGGDLVRHVFRFEGNRDNGSPVRLSFEVTSAEECVVRFESKGRGGEWREHWTVNLARVHERSNVTLRAA